MLEFVSLIGLWVFQKTGWFRFFASPTLVMVPEGVLYGKSRNNSYFLRLTLEFNNPTLVPVQIRKWTVRLRNDDISSSPQTPRGTSSSILKSDGWHVLQPQDKPFHHNFTLEPLAPTRIYAFFPFPPPSEFSEGILKCSASIEFLRRFPRAFHFTINPSEAPIST